MLKSRVNVPSLRAPKKKMPDLSTAIAEVVETPANERSEKSTTIAVPGLILQVIKDIMGGRPPTPPLPTVPAQYIPFIIAPEYSGVDTDLESSNNLTILEPVSGGLKITCQVTLLPHDSPLPIAIYLTGQEVDLPLVGQKCPVIMEGSTKRTLSGLIRHDDKHALYVEVREKDQPFSTHDETDPLTFRIEWLFKTTVPTGSGSRS